MQDNMVEQDQGVHHTEDRVFSQVSGSPVLPGYKRMRTEEDESSSGPTTAFFLSDSRERQRRVMNVLCRDADEDYLDSMDPTQEVNEMHQAWAEVMHLWYHRLFRHLIVMFILLCACFSFPFVPHP